MTRTDGAQPGRPAGHARIWDLLPAAWLKRVAKVQPGERIRDADGPAHSVRFVRSGWVIRTRLLRDGRRQILELLLPGDHLAVDAAFRRDAVSALGPCEVVSVPYALVQEARDQSPALDEALAANETRRAAMLNERLVSLGQRTALERTAHVVCELLTRLGDDGRPLEACTAPIRQADLADLLGLSVVHVNRTLQTLRNMSLVEVGRGRIRAVDFKALSELAGFSPDYLA